MGVAGFLEYKVSVLEAPDPRSDRTFYKAQHAQLYISDLRERLGDDEPGLYLQISGKNLKGWVPLTELDLATQSDKEF